MGEPTPFVSEGPEGVPEAWGELESPPDTPPQEATRAQSPGGRFLVPRAGDPDGRVTWAKSPARVPTPSGGEDGADRGKAAIQKLVAMKMAFGGGRKTLERT